MYTTLKIIHVTCAILSISGFVLRGMVKLKAPHKLNKKWIKVVPHIVDATLLVSAIILVLLTMQYPGWFNWISAKLVALVIYIGLGMLTLRFGKRPGHILMAFLAALVCYTYILGVALNKSVWGFL